MKQQHAVEAKWMLCQDCLAVRVFDLAGHQEQYFCECGGQWCGCPSCQIDAQMIVYLEEEWMRS